MMKLFLSQSYPIEKAALPTKNIKNALVGELAQLEMGGILDFIPDKATQSPFLADLRLQLSEKCDYSADYMLHEFQKVRERHGDWTQFGNSLAYVTLVPEQNSVAIFTKGTLKICRFRDRAALLFETDGNPRLEPTQKGDIWLIFQHNADAPTDQTPSPIERFVYDYIQKSFLEKNYNKNFHILYVENQIDITQSAAIPTANKRMGKGGLTIAKQLLAAEQPFSKVKPLLTVLSRHEVVGTEAKQILAQHNQAKNPEGDTEPAGKNKNSINWRPYIIGVTALVLVSLSAYHWDWFRNQLFPKSKIVVSKIDSVNPNPNVLDSSIKQPSIKDTSAQMEPSRVTSSPTEPISAASDSAFLKIKADLKAANDFYKQEQYNKAFPLFFKHKEHPIFSAQDWDNLGSMYYKGKGVLAEDKMAMDCYQKAAAKGNPSAQNHLGDMYQYGKGVEKNAKIALEWYEKAVAQNHAEAQNSIGDLYLNIYKKWDVAAGWYKKAAEQGDAWAQHNLAYLYINGFGGLPKNHQEAKRLFCLSAKQGNKKSSDRLQRMGWKCP